MNSAKCEKYGEAVQTYIDRLTFKNLQPTTLENYRRCLSLFGSFLAEQPENSDADNAVTYEDMEAWTKSMVDAGNAAATVAQYLTVLTIFFDKATKPSFPERCRYAYNPVDRDFAPKVIKKPYNELLPDEKVAMLYRNAAPDGRFAAQWPRNYAFIQLCLNEKIRNAELLDLKLSDIDFYHHELTVQCGKGRKQRTIDMCELTESALRQYLNSGIRPATLSDNDYLFGTTAAHEKSAPATRTGGTDWHRGTTQWLSGTIERTVRAITGVSDIRSHDLRHIGSRICLGAGESLEQIQGELGHSSKVTTEIYCGRLNARRSRDSARAVLAERDRWAALNSAKLNRQEESVAVCAAV